MPLLRSTMYAQGIEIYCAPTSDPRDLARLDAAHRPRGPVLRAGVQPVHPPTATTPSTTRRDHGEADGIINRGSSCIVDPFGPVLAGPHLDGEAIISAELDPAPGHPRQVRPRRRRQLRAAGHIPAARKTTTREATCHHRRLSSADLWSRTSVLLFVTCSCPYARSRQAATLRSYMTRHLRDSARSLCGDPQQDVSVSLRVLRACETPCSVSPWRELAVRGGWRISAASQSSATSTR